MARRVSSTVGHTIRLCPIMGILHVSPVLRHFPPQNTVTVVVSHSTPTQGVVSGPDRVSPTAHGGQNLRNYSSPRSNAHPQSSSISFYGNAARFCRTGTYFGESQRSRGPGSAGDSESIQVLSVRDVILVNTDIYLCNTL